MPANCLTTARVTLPSCVPFVSSGDQVIADSEGWFQEPGCPQLNEVFDVLLFYISAMVEVFSSEERLLNCINV